MLAEKYRELLGRKSKQPATYRKGCKIIDGNRFLSHAEAATIVGCTPGTISKRMVRYAKKGIPAIHVDDLKQINEEYAMRRSNRQPPDPHWTPGDIKPGPNGPYDVAYSTPVSIRFTKVQHKKLDALCKRTGMMMSEIVRRAVDAYLENSGR